MPITPDDKDWTWVLERACPECRFDPRSVAPTGVAEQVRDLLPRWEAVLGRPDVGQRPGPAVWSPLEYGCHVRDVFAVFERRLVLMLTHDRARFENWDQDETALVARYDRQDPGSVALELRRAGTGLAVRFDQVVGEQWRRSGLRSDGHVFTVATLAVYMMHDPIHHLWDVGAPVA